MNASNTPSARRCGEPAEAECQLGLESEYAPTRVGDREDAGRFARGLGGCSEVALALQRQQDLRDAPGSYTDEFFCAVKNLVERVRRWCPIQDRPEKSETFEHASFLGREGSRRHGGFEPNQALSFPGVVDFTSEV